METYIIRLENGKFEQFKTLADLWQAHHGEDLRISRIIYHFVDECIIGCIQPMDFMDAMKKYYKEHENGDKAENPHP